MSEAKFNEHNAKIAELARLEQRRAELIKETDRETAHLQDAERANRDRQVRADDAFQAAGLRAPEALPGETEDVYRRRLVRSMQPYSPTLVQG